MGAPLARPRTQLKADIIIELPQYTSEMGTLSVFYRARPGKGLVLEKYHSRGDGEPYLAGMYRVTHSASKSSRKNGRKYEVFWSLKGHPRTKVPSGAIREEIIAIAKIVVRFAGCMEVSK